MVDRDANPPIQPQVSPYDCDYDYSLDYWTFLRRLVEEETGEVIDEPVNDEEVLVSSTSA